MFYSVISVFYAFISSFLVLQLAPSAAGSGIPEVKTILSGFIIPDFLSLSSLAVKIVGLVFSVSSGLALGKEGFLGSN